LLIRHSKYSAILSLLRLPRITLQLQELQDCGETSSRGLLEIRDPEEASKLVLSEPSHGHNTAEVDNSCRCSDERYWSVKTEELKRALLDRYTWKKFISYGSSAV